MARSRRVYAAPIVVVAMVSLLPSCAGKVEAIPGDGDGDGDIEYNPPCAFADEGCGTGGSPPIAGDGDTGGSPPIIGDGDIGGNPPFWGGECEPPFEDCASLPPCPVDDYGLDENCRAGESCRLETTCAGGWLRGHVLTCSEEDESTGWQLDPLAKSCEFEFEQCLTQFQEVPMMVKCAEGTWFLSEYDQNYNPPLPCPTLMPNDGAPCSAGHGFDSDAKECGYPCDNGGWSITGCFDGSDEDELSSWKSDGRCLGIGGAAGGPPLD